MRLLGARLTVLAVVCMVAIITHNDLTSAMEERSVSDPAMASPNVQGNLQKIGESALKKLHMAQANSAKDLSDINPSEALKAPHTKRKEEGHTKKKEEGMQLWQMPPQQQTPAGGSSMELLNAPWPPPPKALTYPASVALVTDSNLALHLRKKGTFVLEFYAPWCPHCQREAPIYGHIADALTKSDLHFGTVNCVAEPRLCNAQKVSGYPTFKIMKNGKAMCTKSGEYDAESLIFLISAVANGKGGGTLCPSKEEGRTKASGQHHKRGIPHANPKQRHSLVPARRVNAQDLAAAIHFVWKHTVFTGTSVLAGERLSAMRATLATIAKLPGAKTRSRLLRLNHVLKSKSSWSQTAWSRLTHKLKLWGHAATVRFRVCKGEQHGLACGLWQLFHTMMRYAPYKQAISTVRSFVKYFFDCVPCQKHFAAATKGMSKMNLSRQDAMLMLWRIHNRVSARLAPSYHMKPAEVLYPPRSACPDCRVAGQTASASGQGFHYSAVAAFLHRTYSMSPGFSESNFDEGDEESPEESYATFEEVWNEN